MSVLNKMLRDLEKREHSSGPVSQPVIVHSGERPLWLNMLLLLSLLLLAFAVYAILVKEPKLGAEDAVLPLAQATAANPLTEQMDEHVIAAQQPLAAVVSSDVATEDHPSRSLPDTAETSAEKALAEEAEENSAAEATPQVVTTVATETAQQLPTDNADDTKNDAKPAQLEALPEQDNAVANTATTQSDARATTKAPVKADIKVDRAVVSAQQQASLLQQQALAATAAGNLQRALQFWQQLQQLEPGAKQAYLEQARLWQQLGQPQQALTVLQQALQQGIVDADIQLLLAQQAASQAQWQRVDTLLPAQFALAQQPEYYGLKATALQQLGQPQAALNWFSQLIVLQPQQARWWLGAALAFDAMAQREQAKLHYRQALQWGDSLTAASRNYIQQRLAAIE